MMKVTCNPFAQRVISVNQDPKDIASRIHSTPDSKQLRLWFAFLIRKTIGVLMDYNKGYKQRVMQ